MRQVGFLRHEVTSLVFIGRDLREEIKPSMESRKGGDQPPLLVTKSELARGDAYRIYLWLNEFRGRHGFDPFGERSVEEKKIFGNS